MQRHWHHQSVTSTEAAGNEIFFVVVGVLASPPAVAVVVDMAQSLSLPTVVAVAAARQPPRLARSEGSSKSRRAALGATTEAQHSSKITEAPVASSLTAVEDAAMDEDALLMLGVTLRQKIAVVGG